MIAGLFRLTCCFACGCIGRLGWRFVVCIWFCLALVAGFVVLIVWMLPNLVLGVLCIIVVCMYGGTLFVLGLLAVCFVFGYNLVLGFGFGVVSFRFGCLVCVRWVVRVYSDLGYLLSVSVLGLVVLLVLGWCVGAILLFIVFMLPVNWWFY